MAYDQTSSSGRPLDFLGNGFNIWKRKMARNIKSRNTGIWDVIEDEFVMHDPKNPIDIEEMLWRLNDQALDMIYEALDDEIVESIKYVEFGSEVCKGLEEAYDDTSIVEKFHAIYLQIQLLKIFYAISKYSSRDGP